MSEENSNSNSSCGCGCGGCITFVLFIFMVAAIGWGVTIGKHKWNIDIIPPRIWDMNDEAQKPASEIAKDKAEPKKVEETTETELKTAE